MCLWQGNTTLPGDPQRDEDEKWILPPHPTDPKSGIPCQECQEFCPSRDRAVLDSPCQPPQPLGHLLSNLLNQQCSGPECPGEGTKMIQPPVISACPIPDRAKAGPGQKLNKHSLGHLPKSPCHSRLCSLSMAKSCLDKSQEAQTSCTSHSDQTNPGLSCSLQQHMAAPPLHRLFSPSGLLWQPW